MKQHDNSTIILEEDDIQSIQVLCHHALFEADPQADRLLRQLATALHGHDTTDLLYRDVLIETGMLLPERAQARMEWEELDHAIMMIYIRAAWQDRDINAVERQEVSRLTDQMAEIIENEEALCSTS